MQPDYHAIFWDSFWPSLGRTFEAVLSTPWGWVLVGFAVIGILVPARRRR